MNKTIFVLHERSTKEHFIALETYAKSKDIRIEYCEFLISRYLVKSFVRLDPALFVQQIKNVIFFASLFFSKGKKVILGIAPLDYHLLIIKQFLKRHQVFYFTSWGDWSGSRFPKQRAFNSERLKKSWRDFIECRISGVLCVTKAALDSLKENYQIRVPSVVVGHAVDNSIPLDQKWVKDKSKSSIQLIYVGRLVDTKGIRELIKLMEQLDPENYNLKIVGDGPLKKEVEMATNRHEHVQYLGYVKDKKELFKLYSQSHVQLLFSKRSEINNWEELFGMVIIEAMYCGLITLATNNLGPRSIIENGINGFLIDEDNMIEESLKILKGNLFLEEKMKSNAKRTAETFFKENLSEKWAQVLEGAPNKND